ncbi:hypothetical protein ACJA88_000159 [Fusarium oxysporum]
MRSSITISLLALAPYMADAAKSTTKYSTETVFLPQRKTGSATNIYASLITETGSKTEYLLACQTNFGTSYSCDGDFHGITVTCEESSMNLAVSSTTYDCSLGSGSAVCATITATQTASVQSRTIPSSESELWMTPITFVDLKKRKTTSTKSTASKATETASNKLCKRKIHHGTQQELLCLILGLLLGGGALAGTPNGAIYIGYPGFLLRKSSGSYFGFVTIANTSS